MLRNLFAVYTMLETKTQKRLPLALFIMLITSVLEVAGLSLIFPLLQSIMDSEASPSNVSFAKFAFLGDILNLQSHQHVVLTLTLFVLSFFVLKNIIGLLLVKWQSNFLAEADYHLSHSIMRHYSFSAYLDQISRHSIDVARDVLDIVNLACSGFLGSGLIVITECIMIAGISMLLFSFSPMVMSGIIALVLLFATGFQALYKKPAEQSGQQLLMNKTKVWKHIINVCLSIKEIRVSEREEDMLHQFITLRKKLQEAEVTQKYLQALPRYFLEIAFTLCAAGFCFLILFSNQGGLATHLALLGVFAVSFFRIMPSINRILSALQVVRGNLPAVQVLCQYIQKENGEDTDFLKKLLPEKREDIFQVANKFGELLVLQDIHFQYPSRDNFFLKNINLVLREGESIGLVGGSGSGKTTLVDIMLGLIKPDQGEIFVRGKNIRNNLSAWRKHIGYVPQNIYLWDDTILHNITMSKIGDPIDTLALERAINIACLNRVIDDLPQGFETMVGEQGVQLSGGQKQRIGIARALYRKPDILILDEATSALDNESENRINQMLSLLHGKMTFIIIAHRLASIRRCDKVYVLENGQDSADRKKSH